MNTKMGIQGKEAGIQRELGETLGEPQRKQGGNMAKISQIQVKKGLTKEKQEKTWRKHESI